MIAHKAASIVLARAAQKVGGRKELAARLGLRSDLLDQHMEGTLPVSEDLYLKAVDIVLGDADSDSQKKPPGPSGFRPKGRREGWNPD